MYYRNERGSTGYFKSAMDDLSGLGYKIRCMYTNFVEKVQMYEPRFDRLVPNAGGLFYNRSRDVALVPLLLRPTTEFYMRKNKSHRKGGGNRDKRGKGQTKPLGANKERKRCIRNEGGWMWF
jgi:hypothetical protein